MREIETDSAIFISKLDWIMDTVEKNSDGLTFHTLFMHSNNKLKIEIGSENEEKRRLIYVFYDRQQHFFRAMEKNLDLRELRILVELVKATFSKEHLVRNAHITVYGELYYFVDAPGINGHPVKGLN